MKKGEKAELSASWWKKSQPKGLKTAGQLDKALADLEKAVDVLMKDGDEDARKDANAALDAVDKAADAVGKEATKAAKDAKGNKAVAEEMDATAGALDKMSGLIREQRKWVAEQTQEADGQFSDPDVYHDYLRTMLKRLRSSGRMNFGVVLGKKAAESRLGVHKSKGGRAIAGQIARETGLHQMTFGIARTPSGVAEDVPDDDLSEEKASTLVLELEGKKIAGLRKKITKMLKAFKPLPFKAVQLMVEGKEVEDEIDLTDDEPDDDDAPIDFGALLTRLRNLAEQVKALSDPARKGDLARMASQANGFISAKDGNGAVGALDALEAALKQGGTQPNGSGNGSGNGGAPNATALNTARTAWLITRTRVQGEIEKLRKELIAAYQADGIVGEIETRLQTKAAPVVEAMDTALADKLAAAAAATDQQERATLIADAQKILQSCRKFAEGDAILADLDANPFVPLAIQKMMLGTVGALEKAVH
jgi:hypothetical protein